jgi:hypothetical protein
MITAKRIADLMTKPRSTWPLVRDEPTTIMGVLLSCAVPLAIIPPASTFLGSSVVGLSVMGMHYRTPIFSTLLYALSHYVLSLAGLCVMAVITNGLAPSFGSRKNIMNAVKITVYSTIPYWTAGILLVIPGLSPFAVILSLYGLWLLFTGLPVLMGTPQDKAPLYTIAIVIAYIIVTILSGIVAGLFLPAGGLTIF